MYAIVGHFAHDSRVCSAPGHTHCLAQAHEILACPSTAVHCCMRHRPEGSDLHFHRATVETRRRQTSCPTVASRLSVAGLRFRACLSCSIAHCVEADHVGVAPRAGSVWIGNTSTCILGLNGIIQSVGWTTSIETSRGHLCCFPTPDRGYQP